jgi:hypothetical protein
MAAANEAGFEIGCFDEVTFPPSAPTHWLAVAVLLL